MLNYRSVCVDGGAMSEESIAAEGPHPAMRVEQDGREVLLLEFGAARARNEWLLAENEKLKREVTQTFAQTQEYAALANKFASAVATWRMLAILLGGLSAITSLTNFVGR